jgi:hypothetical protein
MISARPHGPGAGTLSFSASMVMKEFLAAPEPINSAALAKKFISQFISEFELKPLRRILRFSPGRQTDSVCA